MKHHITKASMGLAGIALLALGVVAGRASLDIGDEPQVSAVELPSACDNFLVVSELFAEEGAAAAHDGDVNGVFAPDADTRAYETLRSLLKSCDAELAVAGR
jgi:hypothetical protein